jgi:UrcA family protein
MVLLAALSIAAPAMAVAQPRNFGADDIPQIEVWFGDLNLASPYGAEALLRRLRHGASIVCGGEPDVRESRVFYRRCVRAAVGNAVAKVNAPAVTSLYLGRPIVRDGTVRQARTER